MKININLKNDKTRIKLFSIFWIFIIILINISIATILFKYGYSKKLNLFLSICIISFVDIMIFGDSISNIINIIKGNYVIHKYEKNTFFLLKNGNWIYIYHLRNLCLNKVSMIKITNYKDKEIITRAINEQIISNYHKFIGTDILFNKLKDN